jgi:hypothetical protein
MVAAPITLLHLVRRLFSCLILMIRMTKTITTIMAIPAVITAMVEVIAVATVVVATVAVAVAAVVAAVAVAVAVVASEVASKKRIFRRFFPTHLICQTRPGYQRGSFSPFSLQDKIRYIANGVKQR